MLSHRFADRHWHRLSGMPEPAPRTELDCVPPCPRSVPALLPQLFAYTLIEPIGVVGQIIPWNFPLLMLSW